MATAKITIAAVRKMARLRYGKTADVRHNQNALTKEQKAVVIAKHKELRAEKEACKAELHALGETAKPLREAARFAVDVDAQEPSLSQLRAALERAERAADLRERMKDIEEEFRGSSTYSYRYEVVTIRYVGGIAAFTSVDASADTLEELAAKIEG